MKFNNKKGIIEDALAAIVVIIVAAILTFFIFFINSNNGEAQKTYEIQKQKDLLDGQRLLIEYLTSVGQDGKTKLDYINGLIEKDDYSTIKNDLKSYFEPKLLHLSGWRIFILDNEGEEKMTVASSICPGFDGSAETYKAASIFLPSKSGYSIIRLHYGRGVASGFANAKAC